VNQKFLNEVTNLAVHLHRWAKFLTNFYTVRLLLQSE